MSELKPCPFCGGEAYLERSHRAFIDGKSTKVALVRCKKCNARTERFCLKNYGRTSHSVEAEILAIEAWNRRYEPSEPEHTMEEFMYGQDMGNPEDGSL